MKQVIYNDTEWNTGYIIIMKLNETQVIYNDTEWNTGYI